MEGKLKGAEIVQFAQQKDEDAIRWSLECKNDDDDVAGGRADSSVSLPM